MRMQYRITLSVALGLALILAVFSYLSVSAVDESKDAAAQERLVWAKAVARHVEDVGQRLLGELGRLAGHVAHELEEDDREVENTLQSFAESLSLSKLTFFTADGSPLWTYGAERGADGSVVPFQPAVKRMLEERTPSVAPCSGTPQSAVAMICLAARVAAADGELYGVLLAQVDPQTPELGFLFSPELGERAHVELMTEDGTVVAADLPDDIGSSFHASVLGTFLAQRTAGVRVHEMPSDSPIKTHVVAYAPLSTLPWGVAVEQDRDVALAAPSRLQRKLLFFGLLALVGAALLAWLDARHVVRPLRMLTARASRMAGGDLDTPVGLHGRDEVGMLAQSFEAMRSQLRASLREIEQRDAELERRVQERTRQVEGLYTELRAKEELRGHLLEKLISAQEEERARIARELHDEAGQALTGIIMSLEAAEPSLSPDSPVDRERLRRAKALAQETIDGIRKLVGDLRPTTLDELGLIPALRAYAEERLAERGVKVRLDTAAAGLRLPRHIESSLFRVVQEAVTNIARHAEAKTARIRLQRNGRRLTLLVEDDGKGFDMAEVLGSPDKTRALGLLGMRERVALCGGSLQVESVPGRGTRVRAEIPLPHGNDHERD